MGGRFLSRDFAMAADLVQYSEPHSQTGKLVKFSPCGNYIASVAGYRLILRDVDTLQIVQLYSCIDAIEGLEWSCDSEYVLCSIPKRGAAQVWSVSNKEWHCKIDEGPVGLAHARWSPDGRHVLATADFRLRITIWSLCDRSVFYIRFPKHVGKGLDFTADGSLMALAERTDGADSVGIFDPKGWQPIRQFPVASHDLEDLKWAPNGATLCVVDSVLSYGILIYTPDGQHLQTFRPYDNALGVKSLAWHPHSHLLAVGSYDEKCRLLNSLTWQRLAECSHPKAVQAAVSESAVVWLEPPAGTRPAPGAPPAAQGGYEARRLPVTVPSLVANPDKAEPKVGVGLCEWSAGGRYLATRNDNMPRCVWVWDGETLLLHSLLIQQAHVTSVAWHPTDAVLALCTNGSRVYMWSAQGCRTAPLPAAHELSISELKWNPTGDALLLLDADRFCVCFLSLPPEQRAARAAAAGLAGGGLAGGTEAPADAAGAGDAEVDAAEATLAEAIASLQAAGIDAAFLHEGGGSGPPDAATEEGVWDDVEAARPSGAVSGVSIQVA